MVKIMIQADTCGETQNIMLRQAVISAHIELSRRSFERLKVPDPLLKAKNRAVQAFEFSGDKSIG